MTINVRDNHRGNQSRMENPERQATLLTKETRRRQTNKHKKTNKIWTVSQTNTKQGTINTHVLWFKKYNVMHIFFIKETNALNYDLFQVNKIQSQIRLVVVVTITKTPIISSSIVPIIQLFKYKTYIVSKSQLVT